MTDSNAGIKQTGEGDSRCICCSNSTPKWDKLVEEQEESNINIIDINMVNLMKYSCVIIETNEKVTGQPQIIEHLPLHKIVQPEP